MVLKNYNYTTKYILPLYDYNYQINNNTITFLGAYSYCSQFYKFQNNIFLLYKVKEEQQLNIPYKLFQYYCNNYLIVCLDFPNKIKQDIEYLKIGKFKELSWESKNKILNQKQNKNIKKLLAETLLDFNNRTLAKTTKNKEVLTSKDILDLSNKKAVASVDTTAFIFV